MRQQETTTQPRLPALTGIRALAALAVVGYHFNSEFSVLIPGWSSLRGLVAQGGLGVDLFFLLSGFILTHTYWERFAQFRWSEYLKFVWFRFARIYPAYLAALIAAVGIVIVAKFRGLPFSAASYPPDVLIPELLLVLGWADPARLGGGWNYPDWSVSAEWFAYLFIFPVAMRLVHRSRSAPVRGVFIILPIAGFALATWQEVWPISRSLWMVTCLFLAGSFVRAIQDPFLHSNTRSRFLEVAVLLFCIGALSLHRLVSPAIHIVAIHSAFAALILSLSSVQGPLAAFLSTRPMVYLGEASYSLYLSHGVVQRVLKVVLPAQSMEGKGLLLQIAIAGIYWFAILATAALLYHVVEKPGRDICRRLYETHWQNRKKNQPNANE